MTDIQVNDCISKDLMKLIEEEIARQKKEKEDKENK